MVSDVDAVVGGAYFLAEAKILKIIYLYQSISTKSCDFIPLANKVCISKIFPNLIYNRYR